MAPMLMGVCEKCGRIAWWHPGKCDSCHSSEYTNTNFDYDEYAKFSPEETEKWKQDIRETMVFNSPHFSDRLWRQELRNAEERQQTVNRMVAKSYPNEAHKYQSTQSNAVKCPRCGSTQVQLVQRKWGMLTGFLTNKIDRVCVACKTKF